MSKKSVIVRIQAQLVWEAHQDPASGTWIGICRPLNLNAIGDTWAEFVEMANEAMQLLFEDLLADGELAKFLRLNGWTPQTALPAPGTRARFDIPYGIEQKAAYEELLAAQA